MRKERILEVLRKNFLSKSFYLYLLFGGIATIVDWGSFAFLLYVIKLNYLGSVAISFILGSLTNFNLNKKFNFRNTYQRTHIQFALYLLVAFLGLAITILFMWVFVESILINEFTSRIIVTAIVLVYNYLGHKYITFNLLN